MIMLSTVPQDTDRMNFPTATARLNHTYALPTRNPTNYKRPSKVECLRQYILNILADASLYILSTPDGANEQYINSDNIYNHTNKG